MDRTGPPKRNKPLKAKAEKTREFIDRGRRNSNLSREKGLDRGEKGLDRTKAGLRRTRRKRPPEGPLTRQQWEAEVHRLSGGECIVTGTRVPRRPENFHHVVPKQKLRAAGLHAFVWDPDNGVAVTADVHANHEVASHRIPRDKLPERAIRFARRHGFMDYIENIYPAAGTSGTNEEG